jgi:hypothetical protein
MLEKHIRHQLTPTLTMRSFFVDDFAEAEEEFSHPTILKANISLKFSKLASQNPQERKFEHLENCGELNVDRGSRFDYWPIPNEKIVRPNEESFYPKNSIQTIFVKKKPLEFLDGDYFKGVGDKAIISLFDSIDKIFSLNTMRNLYDTYQITNPSFLEQIVEYQMFTESWISNPNFNECKPLYFECSAFGDTSSLPFGVIQLTRRQPITQKENQSMQIDYRKSADLLKIPFRADLIILPLNFSEFIALVRAREKIKDQPEKEMYLDAWKLLIEKYLSSIPFIYRNYINATLNCLKINDVQALKNRRAVTLNEHLNDKIKKIKEEQGNQRVNIERMFLINVKAHKEMIHGDFPD